MELLSWCCLRAREKTGAYDGTAKKSDGFGSNVAEDPFENAIGYSPILDALEEVAAVKALFGSKREARLCIMDMFSLLMHYSCFALHQQ
eukprot:scaffold22660_cov40-Cyclotella_meneghiniana.AAC.2